VVVAATNVITGDGLVGAAVEKGRFGASEG
jgi:hypothetical protein